jgi:xanthine/CO dehydrogenase XdhC/CoxF family maturation factor
MSEIKNLVSVASRLRRREGRMLLATVVQVFGSSYRRPGARLVVAEDGLVVGSLNGGRMEGDVATKGWWRTRSGPVVVTYDSRGDDEARWRMGLGCDGIVEVLIEQITPDCPLDPLAFLERCIVLQRRGGLVTVFRSDADGVRCGSRVTVLGDAVESGLDDECLVASMVEDARAAIRTGSTRVRVYETSGHKTFALVEAVVPPPRLFVVGSGHDAVPVASVARSIGWDVIVCDTNLRFATRERFVPSDEIFIGGPGELKTRVDASDRAAVILMAHDFERDRDALETILQSRAEYIGLLGPRRRTSRMLSHLGLGTIDDHPRLHATVGVETGSWTPQEIALAVVAEMQRVLGRAARGGSRRSGSTQREGECPSSPRGEITP